MAVKRTPRPKKSLQSASKAKPKEPRTTQESPINQVDRILMMLTHTEMRMPISTTDTRKQFGMCKKELTRLKKLLSGEGTEKKEEEDVRVGS